MKKRAVMFLGVSSSAGKSLCAAALCRILKRKGLACAPFKSQNMSLNSFVSRDGGEMGRAQALQALACGIEPSADMNPILLKPMGNFLSQVIVQGKAIGNMSYAEYTRIKNSLWRVVCQSYCRLAESADVIVLEGAGSPAEINLRKNDIVNIRMAREAEAGALLVADIDRGGAFASLAGTLALLSPADRKYIKAFILNRFRGDKSFLRPAVDNIEKRCRRPFWGIIPMIEDLRLPEEDSAPLTDLSKGRHGNNGAGLDAAALLLPGLSNFTDLDPLMAEKSARLRFVSGAEDFGDPDLVIIPGSKRVAASMRWLEKTGLAGKIRAFAAKAEKLRKGCLIGICAGLQLLGRGISDPFGVEGEGGARGLGLLPIDTVLMPEKTVRRTAAHALPPICSVKTAVEGYEIHHGACVIHSGASPAVVGENGAAIGWGKISGGHCGIWGAYLHGIFENDAFRHDLLKKLSEEAGFAEAEWSAYDADKELDRLADVFMENADMEEIYKMLRL